MCCARLALSDDPRWREALTTRYDINTLTAKQMKDYAALTGDAPAALWPMTTPGAREFIAGRQFIDLLETFPHRLDAEKFTSLLRPLAPRYYSIASSQKLVGEEAHLTIARLAYERPAGRVWALPRHGHRSSQNRRQPECLRPAEPAFPFAAG